MIFALNGTDRIRASDETERLDYLCPHCKSVVRLRLSENKIAHFFHKKRSDCEHESESDLHVNMKFKVAKMLGLNDKYVEYIHTTKEGKRVISDVYDPVTNTAYEVQCSSLAFAEMRRRWNRYETMGIKQVWMFKIEDFGRLFTTYTMNKDYRGAYFNSKLDLFWYYSDRWCRRYGVEGIYKLKTFEDERVVFSKSDRVKLPLAESTWKPKKTDYQKEYERQMKVYKAIQSGGNYKGPGTLERRLEKARKKALYGKDWWKQKC